MAISSVFVGSDGKSRAFFLSGRSFTAFEVPGATFTEADSINARGDIVGGYTDRAGRTHGFLLRAGHVITLDFPGSNYMFPAGINSHGQIVGAYRDATGTFHGFVATPEHGN